MLAIRSSVGVGMTPPKVLGAAKPTSSVRTRRILGAPFGGTTVGCQYGVELSASRLIVPPKSVGGGGICRPSMVDVALGEPGTPVVCWAMAMDDSAVPTRRPRLS